MPFRELPFRKSTHRLWQRAEDMFRELFDQPGTDLRSLQQSLGMGHALYADETHRLEGDGFAIPADQRTKITIDGLAPQTELRWENGFVLWDTEDSLIPINADGDAFTWRFTATVKKTGVGTDQKLLIEQDIGGTIGSIYDETVPLGKAQNEAQSVGVSFPGYGKDTFRQNGGSFYVTPTADIVLWEPSIFIAKQFAPIPGETYEARVLPNA